MRDTTPKVLGIGAACGIHRANVAALQAVAGAIRRSQPPEMLHVVAECGDDLTLDELYEAVSTVYEGLGEEGTEMTTACPVTAKGAGELRVTVYAIANSF